MRSPLPFFTLIVGITLSLVAAGPAWGQDKTPDPALLAKARVTRAQTEKIALAAVPGATVKSSELEDEDGGLRLSFDLTTPGSNKTTEVGVDGVTCKIFENKVESEKDEKCGVCCWRSRRGGGRRTADAQPCARPAAGGPGQVARRRASSGHGGVGTSDGARGPGRRHGRSSARPRGVAARYQSEEATLRAAVRAQFPKITLGLTRASDDSVLKSLGPNAVIDLPFFDRNQGNVAAE